MDDILLFLILFYNFQTSYHQLITYILGKHLFLISSWDTPGGGNGNPFQHSCLENPMDRGPWRAAVHGDAKSWTRLSDWADGVLWWWCVYLDGNQCVHGLDFPPERMVCNQLHVCVHLRFGGDQPVYINIIRDPVNRFLSNYFFRRFGDWRGEQNHMIRTPSMRQEERYLVSPVASDM